MSEVLSDVQKRVANGTRRGVICDIRHGARPECRVRIGDITTAWLPIMQGYASKNIQTYTPMAIGDAVTVYSEAGDLNNGRVSGGVNTDAIQAPFLSSDDFVIKIGDGTTFVYNQSTHKLEITLPEGGLFEVKGDGVIDGQLTIKKNLVVEGDVRASGAVFDGKSSLDRVREIFNAHDHDETDSVTRSPNQQM